MEFFVDISPEYVIMIARQFVTILPWKTERRIQKQN